MNKKLIIGIIIVIVAVLAVGGYFLFIDKDNKNEQNSSTNNNANEKNTTNDEKENNESKEENNNEDEKDNKDKSSLGKVLVVYYSASGSTKKVAEQISKNLDADLFEIIPEDVYTSADLDWTNENFRVTKEHEDEYLRNVKLTTTNVKNWEDYDTVLIGYPIWWGIAAWPVNSFVTANDFTNKTVIPFCTSASSSLGESGKLLESEAQGGKWLEGHRFNSRASSSEIKTWTDSLK